MLPACRQFWPPPFIVVAFSVVWFSSTFAAGPCKGLIALGSELPLSGSHGALAKSGSVYANGFQSLVSTDGHFEVFYTTDTSSVHRVTSTDADNNGIPDFVELTAEVFEQSYKQYVDTMGYSPAKPCPLASPLGNRSTRYLVEIADLGNLGAFSSAGSYGLTFSCHSGRSLTAIENDFHCPNCTPAADLVNYGFHPPSIKQNYREEWEKALRVTIHHEYFHGIQYTMTENLQHFFTEASAVAFEELGAPDVNDYFQYAYSVFNSPGKSLASVEGLDEYGSGLWAIYLMQRFGRGILKEIWEDISLNGDGVFNSFERILSKQSGAGGLEQTWAHYCSQLALGASSSENVFSDAKDFPEIAVSAVINNGQLLKNTPQPLSFSRYLLRTNELAQIHIEGQNWKGFFVPQGKTDVIYPIGRLGALQFSSDSVLVGPSSFSNIGSLYLLGAHGTVTDTVQVTLNTVSEAVGFESEQSHWKATSSSVSATVSSALSSDRFLATRKDSPFLLENPTFQSNSVANKVTFWQIEAGGSVSQHKPILRFQSGTGVNTQSKVYRIMRGGNLQVMNSTFQNGEIVIPSAEWGMYALDNSVTSHLQIQSPRFKQSSITILGYSQLGRNQSNNAYNALGVRSTHAQGIRFKW